MSHFYAASGCVFASASEALDKYLNDFETTTGISLIQKSQGIRPISPQPPVKKKDKSGSLIDRIAASSDSAMVPYMIQKMAERAVSVGNLNYHDDNHSDHLNDDDDEDENFPSSYYLCSKTKSEQYYVCPNQPVTTYHDDILPSPRYETNASLYRDLRRLREQISNRYWSKTPTEDDSDLLIAHMETCKLIEDLKMINTDSEDCITERSSPLDNQLTVDPDTARLSLAVDRNTSPESATFTKSEITDVSLVEAKTDPSIKSHDSGMISPPLPPIAGRLSPPWAIPEIENSVRQRQRHDTTGSSLSLASTTSRISEPKILSLIDKEKIRTKLCELDSVPKPFLIPPAFR